MTNRSAIILAALLAALAAADAAFGWGAALFLGRRLVDLIQTLAFWR